MRSHTPIQSRKIRSEWGRIDMLVYSGAAWFYILLAVYSIQTGVGLWFQTQEGSHFALMIKPLGVYLIMFLQIGGGLGILHGLFTRPQWHGWRWIVFLIAATLGQYIYSDLYYRALGLHTVDIADWLDEFAFIFWLCVGLFGAIIDTLKGPYCPSCRARAERALRESQKG